MPLLHGELTEKILEAFYQVHFELGSGFPESVYAAAMEIVLTEMGLKVEREFPIKVYFRGRVVGAYRADSVVEQKVILEYKSTTRGIEADEAQLLNYLHCTKFEVGLLLVFTGKPIVKRYVMSNDQKHDRRLNWVPSRPR